MKKLHKNHEYKAEWVGGKIGYRCTTCGEGVSYQPNYAMHGVLSIPEIPEDGKVVAYISNGAESGEVTMALTQEHIDILASHGQAPASTGFGWAYFVNVQDAVRDLDFMPTARERELLLLNRHEGLTALANWFGVAYNTLVKAASAKPQRLNARKTGGTWLSTYADVLEYKKGMVPKPRN